MKPRLAKFLSYYQPYKTLLITDLICATIVAAIALVFPLCARYVTKTVLEAGASNALSQIYTVGGIMLLLILVYALCNFFVDYQGHSMGALMERDMRAELFAHYQKLSFGFYDRNRLGHLMNRITHDTFALGELYHHGPEDIVLTLLKFTGTFIILLSINVPLTLIVFCFLPFMALYALYFNRKMNIALRRSKDSIGDINAQVEDSLAGIRTVQSFTREDLEIENFDRANQQFLHHRKAGYKSEAFLFNGVVAFTQLFTAVIIVFGSMYILKGQLDLADLVTYLLYMGILIEPIRTALNFIRLYQEGITGFDRFMEVLDIQPDVKDRAEASALQQVKGDIRFEQVSFAYETKLGNVLEGLALHIHAGEFVALVGPSGVGKSTLCALIPRFYEATQGKILLDGKALADISLASLRENIGVVQQDSYLFVGTIAENIAYGRANASRNEIVAAAQKAHAHDFIMALPDGYDSNVGQRGVRLSGGQRQRLSIARVFLKDPPIIIFDEATSSLDNESERAVQESLEQLRHNRTTLVIAHRLSTIRHAERIIVLDQRGIAEEGKHDALIAKGGLYARLHRKQLRL